MFWGGGLFGVGGGCLGWEAVIVVFWGVVVWGWLLIECGGGCCLEGEWDPGILALSGSIQ